MTDSIFRETAKAEGEGISFPDELQRAFEGNAAASPPARPAPVDGKDTLTYSALSTFRNCRKKFELRYERHLAPLARDRALVLGDAVHAALEAWHRDRDIGYALDAIDEKHPDCHADPKEKSRWHLARAIIRNYARRYPAEEFTVGELEKVFVAEIVNPATGAKSRTFKMRGKIDGIVKLADGWYILEHKTAATIDGGYIEKLWTDFQIALYAHYATEALGVPIAGILYNVIAKTRIEQRAGETEEEYQARYHDLAAKNKSGKSTATRKTPESDEEFEARLDEWYAKPEAFHREKLYLSPDRIRLLTAEIWELTQQILHARRAGAFYQNTAFCFLYNKPCPFWAICSSNENPIVIENQFEIRPPHEELGAGDDKETNG
ncbi:PD-(D/E)XK nuclease family protein [bacterium]|nr:PD-(D/E)XK nuclease family protein [bacterium]